MSGVLFLLALAGQSIALGLVVWQLLKERSALSSLADSGSTQVVLARLPNQWRDLAHEFQKGLRSAGQLDDQSLSCCARAVRIGADSPRSWLLWDLGLALLAMAPLSYAALSSAGEMQAMVQASLGLGRSELYALAIEGSQKVFAPLRPACQESAIAIVGLIVFWAVRWVLHRPETRESRLLQTLLAALANGEFQARATKTARFAQLMSPSDSLRGPAWSTSVVAIALSAAWFLLVDTAPLRAQNVRSSPLERLWPERAWVSDELTPPPLALAAGSPLPKRSATLSVDRDSVSVGDTQIIGLVDGKLPEGWQEKAVSVAGILSSLKHGSDLDLKLLVAPDVNAGTLREVLSYMQRCCSVTHFFVVVERRITTQGAKARKKKGEGARILAGMSLEIAGGTTDARAGGRITMTQSEVLVGPAREEPTLRLSAAELDGRLRSALGDAMRVELSLVDSTRYERLAELMATADTACEDATDCGLFGRGREFVWVSKPEPEPQPEAGD